MNSECVSAIANGRLRGIGLAHGVLMLALNANRNRTRTNVTRGLPSVALRAARWRGPLSRLFEALEREIDAANLAVVSRAFDRHRHC